MRSFVIAGLLAIFVLPCAAQSVQQSGNVTNNHIAVWATTGVIKDGGAVTANDGLTGASTTSIGSGSTYYCSPSGCAATQNIAATIPFTGTLTNLFANVNVAPAPGNNVVVTLMTGTYGSLTATAATCSRRSARRARRGASSAKTS